jgi:hypothetical protein
MYTLDTRKNGGYQKVQFRGADYIAFYNAIGDDIARRRRDVPGWGIAWDALMTSKAEK